MKATHKYVLGSFRCISDVLSLLFSFGATKFNSGPEVRSIEIYLSNGSARQDLSPLFVEQNTVRTSGPPGLTMALSPLSGVYVAQIIFFTLAIPTFAWIALWKKVYPRGDRFFKDFLQRSGAIVVWVVVLAIIRIYQSGAYFYYTYDKPTSTTALVIRYLSLGGLIPLTLAVGNAFKLVDQKILDEKKQAHSYSWYAEPVLATIALVLLVVAGAKEYKGSNDNVAFYSLVFYLVTLLIIVLFCFWRLIVICRVIKGDNMLSMPTMILLILLLATRFAYSARRYWARDYSFNEINGNVEAYGAMVLAMEGVIILLLAFVVVYIDPASKQDGGQMDDYVEEGGGEFNEQAY